MAFEHMRSRKSRNHPLYRQFDTPKQKPRAWQRTSSSRAREPRVSWWRPLIAPILKTLVVIGLAGVFLGTLFFIYIDRTLPDPGSISERRVAQSTKIYDRTGKIILYDVFDEVRRTQVAFADVSPYAAKATISVEDKDFYTHKGFDLKGILRAVFRNVVLGYKAEGGSTLTQQFIKNAVLTNEKTYTRKFKELLLAYRIESQYTKEQILEMYFNEIPYGSNIYGIEAASQIYFGKSSRDLDPLDAAILAGIAKATTYYSPYGANRDQLASRAQFILGQMHKEGLITDIEYDAVKNQDPLNRIRPRRQNIIAPHFVMYVRDQLAQEYGDRLLEEGGLKVITTLDVEKQKAAEDIITRRAPELLSRWNASNQALISLDPQTGDVLAMVGSKDYFSTEIDGNVNVTLRPRQPGSSFKPIVYAAAMEKGYTPDTVVWDVTTTFKNIPTDYTPSNYTGKEYGPVTLRKALAGSLNISAVKTLYLVGIDNAISFAQRLGYTTLGDRSRFGLSLVLGGAEVRMIDHAAAFGVFAYDGKYVAPRTVLDVRDKNGALLEQADAPNPRQVISEQVARQMTSIMSDNEARSYIFGAQNNLVLPGRPSAGKTGTTNDNKDAWMVGYTPTLVTAVWVGNNSSQEMKKGSDGSVVAAPIWNEYMRTVLAQAPVQQFTPPVPDIPEKPILRGVAIPPETVAVNILNGKRATDATPAQYRVEQQFSVPHSILYYVNPADPRGLPPAEPQNDPQFANWEAGVRDYAQRNGFMGALPPEEEDTDGGVSTGQIAPPSGL